jgi:hypothetical protein
VIKNNLMESYKKFSSSNFYSIMQKKICYKEMKVFLKNNKSIQVFKVFCENEKYKLDELLFIEKTNLYKNESDLITKQNLFENIYNEFIGNDVLEIDSVVKGNILKKFDKKCPNDIFDDILEVVMLNKLLNIYYKFINSVLYFELIKK